MDKKGDSPPVPQPNGKILGFKIPKKSPDDWCEEKEVTSPLARLPDNDFRNVTYRRISYGSSYERYNVPRNRNSHTYYASDRSRFNRDFNFGASNRESETGKKYEAQSTDDLNAQETTSSKVCRDVSNTSISIRKDSGSATRKARSLDQEIQSVSKSPEEKNASKGLSVLSPVRDKTYCYKRVEHQNKKSSFSPSAAILASSSSEASTEHTSDSSDTGTVSREKIKATTQENKITTKGGCSSDPGLHVQPETHWRTRRKKLPGKVDNTDALSLETIVLSSDEDEGSHKASKSGYSQKSSDKVHASPQKDPEPMDHSGNSENASAEPLQSETPVLQLKFLNVYFGKKKGRATDSSKCPYTKRRASR